MTDGSVPAATGRELGALWSLVPGDDALPDHQLVGLGQPVPSAFDVVTPAAVSVAAATLAADALARRRGVEAAPPTIGTDHAVAAFTSHLRLDGGPVESWAPLSGRYATADGGHLLVHANFPHHARGVADLLGVPAERERLEAAIGARRGEELEAELIDAGMVAAWYRTLDQWADHPHGRATAHLGLLEITRLGDADPLPCPPATDRALDGMRVLDCSRVLAGPVCGQTLAAHGADVLRVGAAHLPSIEMGVLSTGFGKRNAFVDLRRADGRERFGRLADRADVLIDAYRPGALAGHGVGAVELAERRPGIVAVEISAFDWTGPWAGRRGFDSIVQATTGIARAGGAAALDPADDAALDGHSTTSTPVHLPYQALDHATGFLAAFAALRLVHHQRRVGGSWRARLSLLRTRNWLVGLGGPRPFRPGPPPAVDGFVHTVDSPMGRIDAITPVAGRWGLPPSPLGSAPAEWAGQG